MSEYTTDDILNMIEKLGGPEKLDLSGKDLSGIDLSRETIQEKHKRRGLSNVDNPWPWYTSVTGSANLQSVLLNKANLQGANLSGANLQGASLRAANLKEINLVEAQLQVANLREAILQSAHLHGSNLQDAQLNGANLKGALFLAANLKGADLSDANLLGARLQWANLQGTQLYGANLQGTDLSSTNLQNAGLAFVNLQGAYLRFSNLYDVDLTEVETLKGAYLFRALLHRTWMNSQQIEQVGEESDRDYQRARNAYQGLKVNFKEVGYYDDAHWAYLKERRMERKTFFPTKEGEDWVWEKLKYIPLNKEGRLLRRCYEVWLYTRLFFKPYPHVVRVSRWAWLLSLAQDYFTEYMENPQRIVWRLILPTPLLFAVFYWLTKGVINILPEAPPVSSTDYLFFSLRTLVTLAYSDFTPVGAGQWLAPLEGALGIALFALLAFSVAKRIARD